MLGDSITDQPQELIAAGADKVYLGNAPQLSVYHPELYTEIIVQLARKQQPDIMLLGSTSMGRELAPLVAARLETGLTAHCIDLVLDENEGPLLLELNARPGLAIQMANGKGLVPRLRHIEGLKRPHFTPEKRAAYAKNTFGR